MSPVELSVLPCLWKIVYQESPLKNKGFTIAELLISLAILSVIAVFTIPKIIGASTDSRFNAIAKEDIAALSGSIQNLKATGNMNASTKWSDIVAYLNYITLDSSGSLIDAQYSTTTYTCSSARTCIRMHNGSVIMYRTSISFGGTGNLNAMHVHIDPDGVVTNGGTTDGPGKAVAVFFYYNGRVADEGNIDVNTQNNSATYNPNTGNVPPWFSWP